MEHGNAVVESVASISGEINEDELWVIVKRTVNGATKRYVECFSNFDFDETDSNSFKFLDSHLSYSWFSNNYVIRSCSFRRTNCIYLGRWISSSR